MPYGRHESFHIREGWLSKGIKAVQSDQRALHDEVAPVDLGLGRNMVRALRFWLIATGLTRKTRTGQMLTPFGKRVGQYDPYLEREGTLWLIHYHLACSREHATAWYWFFNHFAYPVFDQATFVEELGRWAIGYEHRKPVAKRTLERDFQVLVRTYLPSRRDRSSEDSLGSPLAELGLLENVDRRQYRRRPPEPGRIHPLVLLYVLLQRHASETQSERQIGLVQVLHEPMSAGRVFNLGTTSLLAILDRLAVDYPELAVRFIRTAGLDRLTLPDISPEKVIERYYREQGGEAKWQ